MKNLVKVPGIIVLAVLCSFLMLGCDFEEETRFVIHLNVATTSGRLTITELDDYDGRFIIATSDIGGTFPLEAAESVSSTGTYTGTEISDGEAILRVWRTSGNNLNNFNTNRDNVSFTATISNKEDLTFSDIGSLLRYRNTGQAKPSWLITEGTVKVNFLAGIGAGLFEEDTE